MESTVRFPESPDGCRSAVRSAPGGAAGKRLSAYVLVSPLVPIVNHRLQLVVDRDLAADSRPRQIQSVLFRGRDAGNRAAQEWGAPCDIVRGLPGDALRTGPENSIVIARAFSQDGVMTGSIASSSDW